MPPNSSLRILIIEDQDADTQKAITIFHKLGLEVQSKASVWGGRHLLEEIAEGKHPPPHLMVLDLGFNNESGFEILRCWKASPALAKIPVILWTQAGDLDQSIAKLFGVSVTVRKSHGLEELEKALKRVIAGLT